MALTVPSPATLYLFWGDEAPDSDGGVIDARSAFWLQVATDLVWFNTQLDTDPADPRQERFVQYAIMDMAIFLLAGREDITEDYSPFSSETIGSYSYSKNFRKIAGQAGNTGVYFYDLLINAFLLGLWDTQGWSNSEDVFGTRYRERGLTERLLHPDDRFLSGPSDGNLLSDFNSTLGADPSNVGFPFGGD